MNNEEMNKILIAPRIRALEIERENYEAMLLMPEVADRALKAQELLQEYLGMKNVVNSQK